MTTAEMIEKLRRVEYCGTVQRACPSCGGLEPFDADYESTHGHRPGCDLAAVLAALAAPNAMLAAPSEREARARLARVNALCALPEPVALSAPDAGLVEAVREWQAARKPMPLPAPGEKLAETYQAAVRRMAAADEALAGYDLNGPAGGALVGQTAPTESTGVSLRDELAEIIRWRFKSADGKPLDGAETLSYAQEIADAIVPMIEEAVGER